MINSYEPFNTEIMGNVVIIQENDGILPDIHSNIAMHCLKDSAFQTNLFYEYYKA